MAEQLLDLDSRKGKAPGGYCETLHYRGRPFIFMNAVGVLEDVSTLLHEGGHAFHAFAARRQPLIWQRHPGLEMCELASMSMESLASPYLDRQDGGFFDTEDFRRARIEHLEDVLLTLSHVASVDAFQSWLYTSGEGGDREPADHRRAQRLRQRARTAPGHRAAGGAAVRPQLRRARLADPAGWPTQGTLDRGHRRADGALRGVRGAGPRPRS